jgi:hypothetical protein
MFIGMDFEGRSSNSRPVQRRASVGHGKSGRLVAGAFAGGITDGRPSLRFPTT